MLAAIDSLVEVRNWVIGGLALYAIYRLGCWVMESVSWEDDSEIECKGDACIYKFPPTPPPVRDELYEQARDCFIERFTVEQLMDRSIAANSELRAIDRSLCRDMDVSPSSECDMRQAIARAVFGGAGWHELLREHALRMQNKKAVQQR